MLPVIELPRLDYVDMKQVSLADIVATNVSAYRFIAGASRAPDRTCVPYEVSLEKDGNELFSATRRRRAGRSARFVCMDGEARSVRLDTNLKPGMIMITGALGRVTDAEPGTYVAHYGPLGELKFGIEGNGDAVQTARQ